MTTRVTVKVSATELCQCTGISEEVLGEIVAQGIIEPARASGRDWVFDARVVSVARRAIRLHRELDLDWSGIAVALELLEELDQLKAENRALRRRLARFLQD